MVVEEFEHESDLVEFWSFRHFVRLLIPADEAVEFEFRKVDVVHLDEALDGSGFFLCRSVNGRLVALGVVVQKRDQYFTTLRVEIA